MWASSQGRVDTVAVLLEAGADVNAVDEDGVSALMWASGSEANIIHYSFIYIIYLSVCPCSMKLSPPLTCIDHMPDNYHNSF